MSAIPFYTMQTSALPAACCSKIEKLIRGFIWGSDTTTRKPSLVNWNEMCLPKNQGGCGIKSLKDQNEAFLVKLAVSLISEPSKLWVQVLRGKYGWGRSTMYSFKTKSTSHTWRSIARVWPTTQLNLSWIMGNGTTIRFWRDDWVGEMGPLQHLTYADIPAAESELSLCEFVDGTGQWQLHRFQHLLPPNLNLQILATRPPLAQDAEDLCYWNLTANGSFSVSSAYQAIRNSDLAESSASWSLFWSWPGIERTRLFLWLAYKGKLLTNTERVRRKMAAEDTCSICQTQSETIDHVLRHCTPAAQCWRNILRVDQVQNFFSKPFPEWILWNLNPRCMGTHWRLFFGTLCWRLWDNRNKSIFANETMTPENIIISVSSFVNHTASVTELIESLK